MNDCKGKYYPKTPLKLDNRTWPEKSVKTAPIWCSVDLRDGNQALSEPMNLEEKVDFFKMLTSIGFKEIEIGFPSASETEFETTRKLIDDNLIPDDVYIQVLVQAREHLINKTFEAIKGAKNVILHLYSGISVNQRDIVFNKSVDEIIEMAVDGARLIKKLGDEYEKNNNMNIRYEYSPEGFTNSEPETAVAICQAVMDVFEEKGKKVGKDQQPEKDMDQGRPGISLQEGSPNLPKKTPPGWATSRKGPTGVSGLPGASPSVT